MTNPTYTDSEFDKRSWIETPFEVAHARFSHDQLTKLCHCAIMKEAYIINALVENHSLSESQIDILLTSKHAFDIASVAEWVNNLSPRQLDFCLRHESQKVRRSAIDHHRCTEAQKVEYHLKWGNDD